MVAVEYRGVFLSTMLRRVAKRMVGDKCVWCVWEIVHAGQGKQVSLFWLSDPLKTSLALEEPRLVSGRDQARNGLNLLGGRRFDCQLASKQNKKIKNGEKCGHVRVLV